MVVELVDFRGDPGVERFGGRSRGSLAEITPSLQDGEAFWGWLPPGFTRGYYHWLPLGAGCGDVVQ